jgi:hypothetical protein
MDITYPSNLLHDMQQKNQKEKRKEKRKCENENTMIKEKKKDVASDSCFRIADYI